MRRGIVSAVVVLFLLRTALVACVGDDPATNGVRRGDENGECFDDRTCNSGLTCLSARCVHLSADAAPVPVVPDSSGPGTPDTGADTGSPPVDPGDASPDAEPPFVCENDAGPCSVPELIAWFRADRGVELKDRLVQSWKDQSPKAHHANLQDADIAPTFWDASTIFDGGPRIEFGGPLGTAAQGSRLVTAAFTSELKPTTMFVVLSKDGDRSTEYVVDGLGIATPQNLLAFTTAPAALIRGTSILSLDNMTALDGKAMLVEAVFDDAKSGIRINNGAFEADGGIGPSGLSGLTIGASRPSSGQTNNFGGSIAEIIVYRKVLDTEQRQRVITWLRARHGL